MKRRGYALLLVLALLVTGCAQKAAPEAQNPEPAATVEPAAEKEPKPEVENNGGYYVRVGDVVYFRRYGADALADNATFGEFTEAWNVDGESELMAYNTKNGELTELYTESGAGALWYGDGGFYLNECTGGESFVAWYALDGSGAEVVDTGTLVGVTDSGLAAVSSSDWDEGNYRGVYSFYRERKLIGQYETHEVLIEAGLTDDGLFLLNAPYSYEFNEDEEQIYSFYQITPQGDQIRLGELKEDAESYYEDIQPDRFLVSDGKALFGVGFYAGTGHFFDYGVFAEATVGQADSLHVLEPDIDMSELYELPYPVSDGAGGVDYAEALPNALRIGWDEDEALELWEDGAWKPLTAYFAPSRSNGWATGRIVQHMDYVGGAAYATVAVAAASPAYDVGWRAGYALASMRYLKVERDGTITELDCVEYKPELFGFVWFIEGEAIALWQQLSSEDGEGWFSVDCAYAFPISEDAYWDEGAFDNVTGLLPYDYGEDEADYLGYPVPDEEPAGELCLTLDRDGTVVSLMRKDPAAVMNIDFDVPEETLALASARLPLERRESDEDTPYHWALLSVLENGVRVRIERTKEQLSEIEQIAVFDGAFIAGETVYDDVLDCGESIAVQVTLPWHPELRVSVSKDGGAGSYIFGEDNYLHLEDENGVHPGMTLAAYPPADARSYDDNALSAALSGTWLHRSADGEADAVLWLGTDGSMEITCSEDLALYELKAAPGRLYASEWEAPDLLCLTAESSTLIERLGFGPNVGDYGVELFRTEGEEILHLTQRNNGDGALGALLPDTAYDYVFTRDTGAGETGARRRGMSFAAELVKYDRDAGLCWLREAELVESDPSIGDVWRPKPYAPCLAYPVSSSAAPDETYPMCFRSVTTDRDGMIVQADPLG